MYSISCQKRVVTYDCNINGMRTKGVGLDVVEDEWWGGDNVRLDHTTSVASARRTSGPGNQNQETLLSYPFKRLHDGEPTIIFADFCST